MTRQELLSSVELNELIRAYKGMLKIQTALIKYNFHPENIEDHIPEMTEESYEILCKMVVAMNDLLTDIHDITEEYGIQTGMREKMRSI